MALSTWLTLGCLNCETNLSKVDTTYIASELNPADIFTKCMSRGVFMSRRALFNQEYTGYVAKAA